MRRDLSQLDIIKRVIIIIIIIIINRKYKIGIKLFAQRFQGHKAI